MKYSFYEDEYSRQYGSSLPVLRKYLAPMVSFSSEGYTSFSDWLLLFVMRPGELSAWKLIKMFMKI